MNCQKTSRLADDRKHQMIKYLKSNSPVIIMILGVIVRVVGYTTSAIRYDEAISLYRASIPLSQFLSDHQRYGSLILWELILRCFVSLGNSLWIIRLPSLLLSCASLLISLIIMKELGFTNFQKSIPAMIIAFTPGLIWIAQDARPYGLIITLYLISILFAIQGKWTGLLGATGLLMFAHSISPAFAASALLFALIRHPIQWKRIVLIGFVILASFIPWYVLLLKIQPTPGFTNLFWLENLTFSEFIGSLILAVAVQPISFFKIIFVLTIIFTAFITAVLVTIRNRLTVSLLFFSPIIIMLVVSLGYKNVIFFRTIIPLIVPFAIWYGNTLQFEPGKLQSKIVASVWIILLLGGMAGWNPADRGGNVDEVAATITSQWENGDILYYSTATVALPFNYYLPEKPAYLQNGPTRSSLTPPTLKKFPFSPLEKIEYKRAWVVFPMDPFMPHEQMKRIQKYSSQGEKIAEIKVFSNPDILVYLVENNE